MSNIITNLREHGAHIEDGRQVGSTLQCPHCGDHFDSIPGSGKRRAWCPKCARVTCGKPICDPCIPFEEWLLYWEGKRTAYTDLILWAKTRYGA